MFWTFRDRGIPIQRCGMSKGEIYNEECLCALLKTDGYLVKNNVYWSETSLRALDTKFHFMSRDVPQILGSRADETQTADVLAYS